MWNVSWLISCFLFHSEYPFHLVDFPFSLKHFVLSFIKLLVNSSVVVIASNTALQLSATATLLLETWHNASLRILPCKCILSAAEARLQSSSAKTWTTNPEECTGHRENFVEEQRLVYYVFFKPSS